MYPKIPLFTHIQGLAYEIKSTGSTDGLCVFDQPDGWLIVLIGV